MAGVRTVAQLRSKYAPGKRPIQAPEAYYDPSFYTAAFR